VPENLTGSLRVTPKIDTGPFESVINSKTIEVRDGRWRDEPEESPEVVAPST
jgi:hypothetical protein